MEAKMDADLQNMQTEMILDHCSNCLWREFENRAKMSKELLVLLQDLYIKNPENQFNEELAKKLFCARFFCGLSESTVHVNGKDIKHVPLDPTCLVHAQEVLKMYPFSTSEHSHFLSALKLQVLLSTYRAGKYKRAKKLFFRLYEEGNNEEYEDEIRELLRTHNENSAVNSPMPKLLQKHTHEQLLKDVKDFLKPIWDKYEIPLLEKYQKEMEKVEDGRIPSFFLQALHDRMVVGEEGEDADRSWNSIINETHPDIKKLKTSKRPIEENAEIDEVVKKSKDTISRLKVSSKQLKEIVKERNTKYIDNDYDDDDDDDDFMTKNAGTSRIQIEEPKKSSHKKSWNTTQKNADIVEWSDSEDEDEDHPIIKLPTRNRVLNVALPSPSKKQKRNPWTEQELSWLCTGVDTYGEGNWAVILRMFPFRLRSAMNLKDKWRNHCKKL